MWERDEQCFAIPHGLRVLWGGVSRAIGRKPVVAGSAASVIKRDSEGAKRRGLLGYAMRSRMHRPMRRPAGAPCLLREARGASGGVRATAPPAGASDSKNRHLRIAGVGSGGCRKGQRGGAGSWGGGSGREARIFCSGQGRAGDDDTDEFYSIVKERPPTSEIAPPGRAAWVVWEVRGSGFAPFRKKRARSSELSLITPSAHVEDRYLVDPASSHMLVSKIKPCMSKYSNTCETANGSLNQL